MSLSSGREIHQKLPHSPRITQRQSAEKIVKFGTGCLILEALIVFSYQIFAHQVMKQQIGRLPFAIHASYGLFALLHRFVFGSRLLFLHFCILYFGSYYF